MHIIDRLISCFKRKKKSKFIGFDVYYNTALEIWMYRRECPKCHQFVYMFHPNEYDGHIKKCNGNIIKSVSFNTN